MRGKAYNQAMTGHVGGITPAHAGKRLVPGLVAQLVQDHPRACGEKTKKIP